MNERPSAGSLDRRVAERRKGERRQEDLPHDGEDRRSGKERRIGERRTGGQLKFCSSCGTKIEGLPAVVAGTANVRLCPDCARQRGLAGSVG